ncbi:MAG: GtrA family protein [Defluviitaleaceae bacterium]|nr:GtrA family protein [Defluviitaleaceae bacterium]
MKKIKELIYKILKHESFKYLVAGGFTTLISIGVYTAFIKLGFDVIVSNTVSTIMAVLFAYFANKVWVFRQNNFKPAHMVKESFTFFLGRFVTYVLDTAMIWMLVEKISVNPIISKLITQVVIIVLNYVVSKKIVFKK